MTHNMSRLSCSILLLVAAVFCGCGRPAPELSTGSLHVDTRPTGATIFLNGSPIGTAPVTVENPEPGTCLVVATLPQHAEARRTIHLGKGASRAMGLDLEPLVGLVLIHASPTNATVTLDDEVRGDTPLLLHDLPYGRHQLNVSVDGYQPQMLDMEVSDRRPVKLDLVMVKDTASLSITSEPEGASVVINGKPYGETPCELERLPKGDAKVRIRKPGYLPHERSMVLRAAESYFIRAQLERMPGTLEVVASPEKAKVYVDDRLMGETPVVAEGLEPGTHRVRVELEGHESQEREISVDGTNTTREAFNLTPNSGMLVVTTSPPGVQVYVDGAYRGDTKGAEGADRSEPFHIEYVPQGTRALHLSKRGYEGVPKTIVIRPGHTTRVREGLRALFVPDTAVSTKRGEVHRGVLTERSLNGDVKLEVRRGAFLEFKANDVIDITPINKEK